MARQKILIADSSEDFYSALTEDLREYSEIKICCDGSMILKLTEEFQPDGIIFDLTISGADGLSVLSDIHHSGCHGAILATTRFVSDYVMDALSRIGVGYVMVKPCNTKAVAERIQDMIAHLDKSQIIRQDPRNAISEVLLSLGFSTKRRGYTCVREAILSKSKNPGQSITKELYPAVGKSLNATGQQVEHVIRTAIASAWQNGDKKAWAKFFSEDINDAVSRPSNGEFISRIADNLDLF